MGSTNDIEQERSINALYLGRADNGSGHNVFKLDTRAVVSVNRVAVIPTPQTIIDQINKMGVTEGIQFSDKDNKITINDLDLNFVDNNNSNSNTSDTSFDYNKERKWR